MEWSVECQQRKGFSNNSKGFYLDLLTAVVVSKIEIVPMRWREKVGSAKTSLGRNQLTPFEVTCDQRTLPTR